MPKERKKSYWCGALRNGDLPVLELPTDRPRPKEISSKREIVETRISEKLVDSLMDPIVATTLWAISMCRHSSQDEIVIGLFNVSYQYFPLIPLLLEVPRESSWDSVLSTTKMKLNSAKKHVMLPNKSLFEQLTNLVKDESRGAVFQTGVVVGDSESMPNDLLNCDLLFMVNQGTVAKCQLSFSPALFDIDSANLLLDHTIILLEALLMRPNIDVWKLSLSSQEEKEKLIQFNDEHSCLLSESTLHDMVEEQAEKTPNDPAVVCGKVELTYYQLMYRVKKLAMVLQNGGVEEGSIVALLLNRSVDIITAELGVMRAGGAFLPMDPTWPEDRINYILDDASCGYVLLHKTLEPRDLPHNTIVWTMQERGTLLIGQDESPSAIGDELTQLERIRLSQRFSLKNPSVNSSLRLSTGVTNRIRLSSRYSLKKEFSVNNSLRLSTGMANSIRRSLTKVTNEGRTSSRISFRSEPTVLATPRSLAYIIYTSGTTGEPKGTLIEHRSVHNCIMMNAKILEGLENVRRFAFVLPYFFDGSIFEQYIPLSCGGCSVVCENVFNMPDDITTFCNVPSALATIPRLPSSIKCVITAAEALTEAALQNIRLDALQPGQLVPRVLNCYGPTECGIGATGGWVGDSVTGSIGFPNPNVQIYIVDPVSLVPQPLGVAGELLVGGIQVGRGYLNRPAFTEEKFITCPWNSSFGRLYRTGDLARWLPNGEIAFLGRIDFQIKLRGKRIELGEIENSLIGPGRDVVVLLRKDFDDNEPRLVAYASPGWGDLDHIMHQARKKLPEYMVPSALVSVPTWPYRAGGKLDRKSLPRPTAEDLKILLFTGKDVNEEKVKMVAPRNEIETVVLNIMADVLHMDPTKISIYDNFFDLGGTSLSSAKVILHLEKTRHTEDITVTDLMENPSPSSLAVCIESKKRRAEVQRRMSFCAILEDLSTQISGSFVLNQERLNSLAPSSNQKSSKMQEMVSQSFRNKKESGNDPVNSTSFISQLYPAMTFSGLCLLRLPYCGSWSVIIWGFVMSLDTYLSSKSNPTRMILLIMSGVLVCSFFVFVIIVILLKNIFGTVPLGFCNKLHSMKSNVMWRIWFSKNLCRKMETIFSMSLWRETIVVVWLARAMGAEIGNGVLISSCSGLFSEAERIKIGDSVVIEDGARICASAFVTGGVFPVNTVIGDNCIVGVKAMVEAGARMKSGLVIQPRRTSIGATSNRAILRSFPKPSTFVYFLVLSWAVLAHMVAFIPLGCALYFMWGYTLQFGTLSSWNPQERLPWSIIWTITSIATPSLACLPLCYLTFFFLFVVTKKLLGSPQPGYLPDTLGERSRWLLMNVLLDSPLLLQLWFVPHSWQRGLMRTAGSNVGRGAFIFLEALRYDSHLLGFGDGSAIGGDLIHCCLVPDVDIDSNNLRLDPTDSVESDNSRHIAETRFQMKRIYLADCAAATHGAVLTGGTTVGSAGVVGDYTVVDNTNIPDGTALIGSPAIKIGQLDEEAIEKAKLGITVPTFVSDLFDFCVWLFIVVSSILLYILVIVVCVLGSTSLMSISWPIPFTKILVISVSIATIGFLLVIPFIATTLLALAKRTVLFLPEGITPFYTWGFRKWLFSNMLFNYFAPCLDDYYGTEIMCIFFRMCGAKIGKGVKLFSGGGPAGQGHIRNELEHLVIEDNVVLDTESLIQGHTIENGGMTFKMTVLSANSIISSRSNILPGALVGNHSILLEGTLIPPHTTANGNSLVSGCPFRIILHQDGQKAISLGKSQLHRHSFRSTQMLVQESLDVDHIVIGAGVCGLLAAKELKERGKSFIVLEKSAAVGGIWTSVANTSSHVAVSEPSYRFNFDEDSVPMEDFTPSGGIKNELHRFLQRFELLDHIQFGAYVTNVKQNGDIWKVVYKREDTEHVLHAKGAFIAIGAQQKPRKLMFKGENAYTGTLGYGIRDDIKPSAYKGSYVCIIGGGAFAVENIRTALLNGAKKVTIVSRSKIQCWPRAIHYRMSFGNATWGELKDLYEKAIEWAGLSDMMENFMFPYSRTQPTVSDFFYLAFKEGVLDIVIDQVSELLPDKIVTKKGVKIFCNVVLKCVGWEKAQMREVYADFQSRNFCFLDGHASLVSCSDTVFSHVGDPVFTFAQLEHVNATGSNSVVFLALVTIRLQLFFMEHPEQFAIALKQIVGSPEPTCSWMQERLHFVGLPEAEAVTREVTKLFRRRVKMKFPTFKDFLSMCKTKSTKDAAAFLDHPVGYIFDDYINDEI